MMLTRVSQSTTHTGSWCNELVISVIDSVSKGESFVQLLQATTMVDSLCLWHPSDQPAQCSASGEKSIPFGFVQWNELRRIQLGQGADSGHADDTRRLKVLVVNWLMQGTPRPEPPLSTEDKTGWGFYNNATGHLLCPVNYDWNNTK